MANIFREILDDESRVPSIDEKAFKEFFLDKMVSGDKDILSIWINDIAIKPTSPVRVVDKDEHTLFIVPPITRGVVSPDGVDPNAIVHTYRKILDSGRGVQADNFLYKELSEFKNLTEEDSDIEAWHGILVRYGYAASSKNAPEDDHLIDEEEEGW